MRKDQIFVLLLIILLPLSGCMDGAIGDADAQDSTEEDGTVVNYYYNNTTNHVQNEPTLNKKENKPKAKFKGCKMEPILNEITKI